MMQNNGIMLRVVETGPFQRWMSSLRDRRAQYLINTRLSKIKLGMIGDARAVGGGVSEMRIHYGPGYRIYFIREGGAVIVLLCGGDKDSQSRDINRARRLAADRRAGNV